MIKHSKWQILLSFCFDSLYSSIKKQSYSLYHEIVVSIANTFSFFWSFGLVWRRFWRYQKR